MPWAAMPDGGQRPRHIQAYASGRVGISDLLKQLVRLRLPVAPDQKATASEMRPCHGSDYARAMC